MKKMFMGVRLRRLREERGLNQVGLAQALGLSPSYLNQLEQNQRPLTVPVLLKINAVFGIDVQVFSEDDEARLTAGMREVLADATPEHAVSLAEMREVAANMPAVARSLIALHQRYRATVEQMEALAGAASAGGDARGSAPAPSPMSFEDVRDFFFAHRNYIGVLDEAAERVHGELQAGTDAADTGQRLAERLRTRHGVTVVASSAPVGADQHRHYDPQQRLLALSPSLGAGRRAFQLATQLALLEMDGPLRALVDEAQLAAPASRALLRIGLAHYFAGALLLPYQRFLDAAEALRYDIDRLGRLFGVGFETVCHRLSTLQRPQTRGVPFFFIRVDRAGNISKRQSATHFHFSKVGGTCPLWNVYEAFAQPGRILTQLARMPDGRSYLWVARSVSRAHGGYGSPGKTFAIALGCDLSHAHRLVYSKGLDLQDPEVPTPIGMGCKVCERADCPQRAFPFIGRPLDVNENEGRFAPYTAVNIGQKGL
jgi:predicted transcriptional regulator/transcriptional regulator with XRE-family HTH domain